MKKSVIFVLALIVLVGLIFLIYSQFDSQKTQEDDDLSVLTEEENTNGEESDSTGQEQSPETKTIEISDFKFVPQTITIKGGDSITWINRDSIQHSATSDTGAFDSGLLAKNREFTFTFDGAGEFSYHCTPHPYMKATIIVE